MDADEIKKKNCFSMITMETIQRKNRKKHLRKKTEIIENGNGEKKITIYK